MDSRQACWLTVLEFVRRCGVDPATALIAGTPAWHRLPDDHPDKLGAVLAAGVLHVLRIDTLQAELAEASHEIACAADWSAVAQRVRNGRGAAYVPRQKGSAA
jgi:hypothetical protein